MKILHTIQAYSPYVGGSEEVVRRLSERLAHRGHDVTVATSFNPERHFQSLNGVKLKTFKVSGNVARGLVGEVNAYLDYVLSNEFDVVMNYAAQSWTTDILLPHLMKIKGKKILAPCGYSGLYDRRYQDYFRTLPEYLRGYDQLVYHSGDYRDKHFGDAHNLGKYVIIPNFAEEIEFRGSEGDFRGKYGIGEARVCLTVANHFRAKGHSLVIDAFLKSGLENAVLVIIGNPQKPLNVISDCYYQCRISEWAHQGKIKILANVSRQDTIMAFHAASLFVFGSEIECSPLVIFEAMASKTPWLSTAVGNVHELEGGIIVKSMEDMAAKMKQVLNESSLHELLAKSGYDAWRAKYTLERVTNLYEDLYSQVTRT